MSDLIFLSKMLALLIYLVALAVLSFLLSWPLWHWLDRKVLEMLRGLYRYITGPDQDE